MYKKLIGSIVLLAAISCTMVSCATDSIDDPYTDTSSSEETESSESSDTSAQEWIDGIMVDRYLYNDEYKEMTRDMSLSYDEFLYSTLWAMTTNVLDKKIYSETYSELFSYVTRISNTKSSYSENRYSVGYGVLNLYSTKAYISSSQYIYYLTFESIYPSSPLDEAGVSRSSIIIKVNGEYLYDTNIDSSTYMLRYPTLGDEIELEDIDGNTYTISARNTLLTPILNSQIIEKDGGKIVGYLNYASFDIYFEDELLDALSQFNSEGVTDLILDMRSNPGGYIYMANELCSCIASITQDTPLIYRRYNDYLTEYYSSLSPTYTGLYFDSDSNLFYSNAMNDASIRSSNLTSLREKKIYCLTSMNTASASELVINSLRGIGFDVVTIGSTSRGKNVGSTESSSDIGDYTYYLYPITMQMYNAELFGDYEDGFTPTTDNIVYEGYFLSDYGEGEPLFDRAMELITGDTSRSTKSTTTTSRSSGSIELDVDLTLSPSQLEAQRIMQPQSNSLHGAIDLAR